MNSIARTRRIQATLTELNALRSRYGGCEYSMGQVKKFASGASCEREKFLTDWISVYSDTGPVILQLGSTIDAMDAAFAADPEIGYGPVAYRIFVHSQLVADNRRTNQTTEVASAAQ